MPRSRQCFASSSVGIGLKVHPMMDCLIRAFLILKSGSSSAIAREITPAVPVATAPLSRFRRLRFVMEVLPIADPYRTRFEGICARMLRMAGWICATLSRERNLVGMRTFGGDLGILGLGN